MVSVLMPMHNGREFVEEAIRSVQAQSFDGWELVVADDASTDGSPGMIEVLMAEDPRIRLIRLEHNKGAAAARNAALEAARGRYIAFLDCDDAWLPHKLKGQVELLSHTGAGFGFGAYKRVDAKGRELGAVGVPACIGYADLLKTNYVGCLTAIYDTKVFGKVPMPEAMACHEDYPVWLRLLREAGPGVGVMEPVARYRVRSGSLSANKLKTSTQTWRVYREMEGLALSHSAYCFVNQTGRALVRNHFPRVARWLGWLHPVAGE